MLFSRPEVKQQLNNMLNLYERRVNQQLINFVTSWVAKLINCYPTSYSDDQQVDQLLFNLEPFQTYIPKRSRSEIETRTGIAMVLHVGENQQITSCAAVRTIILDRADLPGISEWPKIRKLHN